MLFFLPLSSSNILKTNRKNISSTTVFNINNRNNEKKCFLSSKSAWMVSERSRDTEDWSNDAENQE